METAFLGRVKPKSSRSAEPLVSGEAPSESGDKPRPKSQQPVLIFTYNVYVSNDTRELKSWSPTKNLKARLT